MAYRGLIASIIASAILTASGLAWAGSVVAIVEEIEADRADVAFMDYLGTGRTIVLGKQGRLVLGYLKSCLREVITGGTVTVGVEKSVVKGGKKSAGNASNAMADGCCSRRKRRGKARRWSSARELLRRALGLNSRRSGFTACNRFFSLNPIPRPPPSSVWTGPNRHSR